MSHLNCEERLHSGLQHKLPGSFCRSMAYWQYLSLEGLLTVSVTRGFTDSFCHCRVYWQFVSIEGLLSVSVTRSRAYWQFFVTRGLTGSFCNSRAHWQFLSLCHSRVYWQFVSLQSLLTVCVTPEFIDSLCHSRVYWQFVSLQSLLAEGLWGRRYLNIPVSRHGLPKRQNTSPETVAWVTWAI